MKKLYKFLPEDLYQYRIQIQKGKIKIKFGDKEQTDKIKLIDKILKYNKRYVIKKG